MTERTAESVDQALRAELMRENEWIVSAPSLLRHLLSASDRGLFSDERIARVRGMVLDVSRQLLFAEAAAIGVRDRLEYVATHEERLAGTLVEDSDLLVHILARAIEAEFTERLEEQSGIDSALSRLTEDLAAGGDAPMARLAMTVLAAQARFVQHCRRSELPVDELPGDLFHRTLLVLRASGEGGAAAEERLRRRYDEAAGRLALLAQLVVKLGTQASRALSVGQAGLAIFATALAAAAGLERDKAVLSLAGRHYARFALALRAAGLEPQAVAEQFLRLGVEGGLHRNLEAIGSDRAAALLAGSWQG